MPVLTPPSSVRRAARALALVAAMVVLPATAGTASAAGWQTFNTDADRLADIAAIDRNGNGVFDDAYFDLDNDGRWDTNLYNTHGADSLLDVVDFDMDENDEVEVRLRDGDGRPGFDFVLVDFDQNGAWDRRGGYIQRIIPGSNLDAVNRINRQNASRDIMFRFRQRTGMSLLYPSFPMCC